MRARLFRAGARGEPPFEFGELATVGRGETSTLRLDSDAVSHDHARIYFDAERGRYVLEDLGSLNGTRLDGVSISRPEPLDRLHVIEFGGGASELVFQAVDLSPTSSEEEAARELPEGTAVEREMPVLPPRLADDAAEAAGEPGIAATSAEREMPEIPSELLASIDGEETVPVEVEQGSPEPHSDAAATPIEGDAPFYLQLDEPAGKPPVPLQPGAAVVGRARSADISVESSSVSRRHALLTVGEKVTVRDLGSRNHTFVDDRPIEDEVEIRPGSRLRFGGLGAKLLGPGGSE